MRFNSDTCGHINQKYVPSDVDQVIYTTDVTDTEKQDYFGDNTASYKRNILLLRLKIYIRFLCVTDGRYF